MRYVRQARRLRQGQEVEEEEHQGLQEAEEEHRKEQEQQEGRGEVVLLAANLVPAFHQR